MNSIIWKVWSNIVIFELKKIMCCQSAHCRSWIYYGIAGIVKLLLLQMTKAEIKTNISQRQTVNRKHKRYTGNITSLIMTIINLSRCESFSTSLAHAVSLWVRRGEGQFCYSPHGDCSLVSCQKTNVYTNLTLIDLSPFQECLCIRLYDWKLMVVSQRMSINQTLSTWSPSKECSCIRL